MKYSYDDVNKILTLDGEHNLILSKNNDFCIYADEGITSTKDFKLYLINHYCCKVDKGIKSKLASTRCALKYIWRK